jgi:hypothetical protein
MKTHYKTDRKVPAHKGAEKSDARFQPRAFDAVAYAAALEVLG